MFCHFHRCLFWPTLLTVAALSCTTPNQGETETRMPVIQRIDSVYVGSSIRALEVVDDSTVWFAGSGGTYGYTSDGGNKWTIDTILHEDEPPHFRSISVTQRAVFLLSIGSPALLYRSEDRGLSWQLAYREDDPAAFYDAMQFWDDREGIAMGDPTDGCLSVIITRDGGRTWNKLSCDQLPAVVEGEAAFAASNSNLALMEDHVWMVSGGERSRVFHSADRGQSWEVFETPVVQGGAMTGIFSVDFWDQKNGMVFGGDWEAKDHYFQNKAITRDGGRTWSLVSDGKFPGYRSCVQYFPDGHGMELLAVGIPGIAYSADGGESWTPLSDNDFYTVRFGSSRQVIWAAGNWKVARLVLE